MENFAINMLWLVLIVFCLLVIIMMIKAMLPRWKTIFGIIAVIASYFGIKKLKGDDDQKSDKNHFNTVQGEPILKD